MGQQDIRPLTARAPWRQVYALYRLIGTILRLPYWMVASLISRPPNWTFKQAVLSSFFRDYVDRFSLAGVNETTTLEPGKQGVRFKVIDPAQFASSFFKGPAVSTEVAPAKVGGTWYPAEPTTPTGPIFLWLHGGAFVMGNSRDEFAGFAANTLVEHGGAEAVFCLEYRLSGYGKNPFPAALQDTITAYLYLTETLKIPSSQITIGGDSAGGNLAIAFLRYLKEQQDTSPSLPPPSSAALASPWVSPLECLSPSCTYTTEKNWASDYLPLSFLQWGARTYQPTTTTETTGEEGIDEAAVAASAAYITPMGNPLATEVPIFVWYGEREIFAPRVLAWGEEMQKVPGNKVDIFCEKDAVHDTIIIGNVLGWEESAQGVATRIGEFVRSNKTSAV